MSAAWSVAGSRLSRSRDSSSSSGSWSHGPCILREFWQDSYAKSTTCMIRTDIPPVFIAADAEHRWAVAVSARSGSTLASRRGILGLSRLLCLLLFLLLGLGWSVDVLGCGCFW